jgi:serine/threonine protein kinase
MEMYNDPYLGQMIRGYRLEERLGQSNVTWLYRARTREPWQIPRLSIMLLPLSHTLSAPAQGRFLTRFFDEAKRCVKLRHSALFPLFGYGMQNDYCYLMMPDMLGGTLEFYSKRHIRWNSSDILYLLTPVAHALAYMHGQGLVYEYLNPSNILLLDRQTPCVVGVRLEQILRQAGLGDEHEREGAALLNIAGTPLGWPECLAPEVIKGGPVDARADVYTLGILLFELLSGRPPYRGGSHMEAAYQHLREPLPSLHAIAPDIPLGLEIVVNRALHHDPQRRFATPGELMQAYAQALNKYQQTEQAVRHEQSRKPTQPLAPLTPLPPTSPEREQTIDTMVQEIHQRVERILTLEKKAYEID